MSERKSNRIWHSENIDFQNSIRKNQHGIFQSENGGKNFFRTGCTERPLRIAIIIYKKNFVNYSNLFFLCKNFDRNLFKSSPSPLARFTPYLAVLFRKESRRCKNLWLCLGPGKAPALIRLSQYLLRSCDRRLLLIYLRILSSVLDEFHHFPWL